ncbi:hypothetical protein KA111_02120 [Candidatus Woesebacteria bacterium]|nr:hypothetical protein [Candidatus Woesebacteria bacterium]
MRKYPKLSISEIILTLVAIIIGFRFFIVAINQLNYKAPLNLVEGYVLQNSNNFPNWNKMYPSFKNEPSLLNAYTPVFYGINHIIFGESQSFFGGRFLSIISLLIIFKVLISLDRRSYLNKLTFFIIFFSSPDLIKWFTLNRVCGLAIAFSIFSIWVFEKVKHHKIFYSALFLSLAVLTKQNIGIPAFVYMIVGLLTEKKYSELSNLIKYLISFIGIPFLIINLITNGSFYFNLITVNFKMDWSLLHILPFLRNFFYQNAILLLLLVIIAYFTKKEFFKDIKLVSYVLAALLITITAFKAGSDGNYFLEATIGLVWLTTKSIRNVKHSDIISFLLIIVYLAININFRETITLSKQNFSQSEHELLNEIQRADKILADDNSIALLPLAGKEIIIDPFATTQMLHREQIENSILINYINTKKADLILISIQQPDFYQLDSDSLAIATANKYMHWSSQTYIAMWSNYRFDKRIGKFLVFKPK